ncbi:beta propeller repeat protein [Desulfothermus naphthae]
MLKKQNGSVLLYIVVVMVISLLLAGGLYIMSSTALFIQPSIITGERAQYIAEAGYRYAAARYLHGQNSTDKIDILESLDNSTYSFDDGSSFTLHIYPFFFRLPQSYDNAMEITLDAPGSIPHQVDFPDEGYLKIGDSVYHYTNGQKVSQSNATVRLDNPLSAQKDTPVYFAFHPKYSQDIYDGCDLTLDGDDKQFSVLPKRNGYIEINGETYFYHFKKQGSIILTELKKEHFPFHTIHIDENTPVVLRASAYIESIGRVGSFSFLSSSRKISYYVPITDEYYSPGGGTQVLALSDEDGGQDTFDDLSNWDTSLIGNGGQVTTDADIGSNHGWSKRWATFYDLNLKIDFNPTLMDSNTNEDLHAIWGNSWDNVYAVGSKGTILHFDGNEWQRMDSPVNVTLRDIYGFGDKGSEKMVAVGDNGEILLGEMDGDEIWKRNLMTKEDGSKITYTPNDLYAVWGTDWNHITTYGDFGSSPFKWNKSAGKWPRMRCKGCEGCWNPATGCYKDYLFEGDVRWRPYDLVLWKDWHFRKSWEYDNNGQISIFICGKNKDNEGFIYREKPSLFSYYKKFNSLESFNSIWGSSLNDIYVVGNDGKIYHNDNGGSYWDWSKQTSGTNEKLNGVWGQTCGDIVYVVGDRGTLLYKLPKDSPSWNKVDLSSVTNRNLNEVWGDPDVGIYAVGDEGTILFLGFVSNPYKELILPFKSFKFNEIEEYWANHHKLLSYTAQVKVGWGYELKYGATGLNFRWHESEQYPGLYEGYGVSFMVYEKKQNCENDYIPNGIKPEFGTQNELNDKLLLVLWRQKVVNGAVKREWIAYKDLDDDEKLKGDSWDYSGRLEDLSTLVVRIEEKKINGKKINDVKIFYGDASTANDELHIPDSLYNNTNRTAYNPTYSDVSITEIKWPLWDLNNWNPDVDFFTLICNVPVSENPQPQEGIDYWILNPDVNEAKLLSDGATIRLTGFTSPDGDSFYLNNDNHSRPEVALHAYGDIKSLDSQTFVSFSEFALSLGSDLQGEDKKSAFGALY